METTCDKRGLNGHESSCLADRKFMKTYAEILTGYELSEEQLTEMIESIKKNEYKN